MEGINLEIVVFLLAVLAFGSSLIHYSTYARAKAKVRISRSSENFD